MSATARRSWIERHDGRRARGLRARAGCHPRRGARRPRHRRRGLHPPCDRNATTARGGGRVTLLASLFPPAWLAGTALLAVSKILENLEIGHNVMHGQWDWMQDPDIHSSTYEWDSARPRRRGSAHTTTAPYLDQRARPRPRPRLSILRIEPDQPWHPIYLPNPFTSCRWRCSSNGRSRSTTSNWRTSSPARSPGEGQGRVRRPVAQGAGQVVKDYVAFPLLAGPSALPALRPTPPPTPSATCGRTWSSSAVTSRTARGLQRAAAADETRGGWYRRQLLGSCNLDGPPLLHLMSGNLSFQIEHHLFPDLPSNRYAAVAPRVREICERHGLPYTSGSLRASTRRSSGRCCVSRFPAAARPGR